MSAPQSAAYGRMPPCVISKAREDLPCLQGVKRARRNRRHMGVCPWQLVAESASFSAADYRAQASGEIFGKLPQELFTVCLATPDCIQPSRGGAKTRSKACVVLPCLQGVKRARRNRRHMGASPWQFVAESVSFFCRRLLRSGYAAAPLRVTQKSRAAFFIISCASENHAFSSELSTALSHCSFGAMLACALRSSSSQNLTSLRFSGALLAHPYLAILCLMQER